MRRIERKIRESKAFALYVSLITYRYLFKNRTLTYSVVVKGHGVPPCVGPIGGPNPEFLTRLACMAGGTEVGPPQASSQKLAGGRNVSE